ncbi:MAG TPA: amidohydrolase family protein [Xanthobacteraceae bacterium]|jgi:5-methylthioadenosine/S-adenosylhomocysteine deaminase
MGRVLIKNGYVVTVDRRRNVYPGGFVLLDGNRIESVGDAAELPKQPVDRTIDARGMIVIPGLINVHQHFYYHLFKGLGHGLLLEDWFPHLVFPVLPHLTDDDMELTSYLAGIEMLSTGTTCCLNHLRTTTSEALLERITAPTAELGFRQVVGKEVQCRLPGNPRHPRDLAEEIAHVEDLIPRWRRAHDGLTRLCLVAECTSVFVEQRLTSEQLLIESKRLADRHGMKLAAHISGGTLSFDKSYLQLLRKTGQTDTQMLMQLGLLDASWILVHGINCTPIDLRLIADSGASLVYCPTSEAMRGGGIGPAAAAVMAGVNVALGSDGPMVDDSVDMIEQMKACSFLQGVKHLDPTIMPVERCLEMATINAACALGLDGEIGSLEPGKLADVAVFDLDTPHSTPATNPIASLVCSARGPDAHTVFVDGRDVVRAHRLTGLPDLKPLFARARARAQEIVAKAGLADRAKSCWLRPAPAEIERTMAP